MATCPTVSCSARSLDLIFDEEMRPLRLLAQKMADVQEALEDDDKDVVIIVGTESLMWC